MIKIQSSGDVISDIQFFQLFPNVAFPSPLTNLVLAEFGAELVPDDLRLMTAEARARINAWRDEQEAMSVTFPFSGRMFDADLASKNRLSQLLELGGVPAGFYWTDAENVDVPMDYETLKAMGEAMTAAIVMRGWTIHCRQREMKAGLASMSSEQIKSFSPAWS